MLLVSASAHAQNMANSESYDQAYKEMPDGSSRYVGKCKTHEDYKGKRFVVTGVIQKYVEPFEYTVAQVKKIVDKVGMSAFRALMKEFFSEKSSSDTELMKKFAEYADDITIETIMVKDSQDLDLLRFNVGYGGGNGGYLVLLRTSNGYKKMSLTNDSDLSYCDKIVWKN